MKKVFLALATLGFVACAENDEMGKQPIQDGEKEQSYVAITLTADDITRATNGNEYDEGTAEERAVNSAYVFFFKENGEPFYVTDGDTSTNSGSCNYIEVDLTKEGEDMDNVSDVTKAVLVLKNYKGEYPSQVFAVLNWNPAPQKSYTLSNLQTKLTTLGDDTNGYVMCNSVYLDKAGKAKYSTDLRIENIIKRTAGESEDDAKARAAAAPVFIHVERVAAKVMFDSKDGGKFHVGEVDSKPVYAQITGFELYNDYEESWLVKQVEESWGKDDSVLGFSWNESSWFRSYWAKSIAKPFENNTFTWNHNADAEKYNSTVFVDGATEPLYCCENTRDWTTDDVRTKVIVKAQLQEQNGTVVNLVQWYGKHYVGESTVKRVVANTLANNYYSSTNGFDFIGILGDDIKCVRRDVAEAKAFEVYFQLSDNGEKKTWYEYKDGGYVFIDKATLNTRLAAVEPALVYTDGMTYYYTDIKHLGAAGYTTEFGVVRNHAYRVNITDVVGYGTPVYDGSVGFLTPEKPQDASTYVAAQINILSWRIVDADYEI